MLPRGGKAGRPDPGLGGSRICMPPPNHVALVAGSRATMMAMVALMTCAFPVVAASGLLTRTHLADLYQGLSESNLSIVYPILGLPGFASPGTDLQVRVVAREEAGGAWGASISTFGHARTLAVVNSTFEDPWWLLSLAVPSDTPCGLYDLQVGRGDTFDVERHALAVDWPKERIRIVHLTDIHADRYLKASPRQRGLILHTVDVVNLIRPDLVVITGDFQDPGGEEEMLLFAREILLNLQVPACLTPGNHEFKQDNVSYFRFLNPYPDYAFDLGPVRIVSLDQYQSRAPSNGQPPPGNLIKAQLEFLDDILADNPLNISLILFHEPGTPVFRRPGPILGLCGHTHDADAMELPGGGLQLVTSMASLGIRVIEFAQNVIITSTYDPDGLRTDLQVADLGIRILQSCRPIGTYQSLTIHNDLGVGLANVSWVFNLSSPAAGWLTSILGASLIGSSSSTDHTAYLVCFDVPDESEIRVECISIDPDAQDGMDLVRSAVESGRHDLDAMGLIIQGAGGDPDAVLRTSKRGLDDALRGLESGNFALAALGLLRSDAARAPLGDVVSALEDAHTELDERRRAGLDVAVVEPWLIRALDALQGGDILLAEEHLARITSLQEDEWILANEIGEAQTLMAKASESGLDMTQPGYRLTAITRYYDEGSFARARDQLDRLRAAWPDVFKVADSWFIGALCALVGLVAWIGRANRQGPIVARALGAGQPSG